MNHPIDKIDWTRVPRDHVAELIVALVRANRAKKSFTNLAMVWVVIVLLTVMFMETKELQWTAVVAAISAFGLVYMRVRAMQHQHACESLFHGITLQHKH